MDVNAENRQITRWPQERMILVSPTDSDDSFQSEPESEGTEENLSSQNINEEPGVSLTNEAFVGLLIAHDQRVRGFLTSLMLPSSEVEDVFQNTSVSAFRKLDTFRYRNETPDEEFIRWVCTIAKYEVLRYYQKARRAKVVFSTELVEELADLQLRMQAELGDRHDALFQCIEQMPTRTQELIKMRYGTGHEVIAIANRLGISASGVYKSLKTVRSALQRCIEARLRTTGVN